MMAGGVPSTVRSWRGREDHGRPRDLKSPALWPQALVEERLGRSGCGGWRLLDGDGRSSAHELRAAAAMAGGKPVIPSCGARQLRVDLRGHWRRGRSRRRLRLREEEMRRRRERRDLPALGAA
uniref:Uncharacterized protein n=1 Tax=Setaria italica TaxID=4555 RepID=K3ZFY3_SETIT